MRNKINLAVDFSTALAVFVCFYRSSFTEPSTLTDREDKDSVVQLLEAEVI